MESTKNILNRMPLVDDITFWFSIVSGLLLFAGITGAALRQRPLWETVGAFIGFAVYASLAWKRNKKQPLIGLELLIAALSVLVDLIATQGLFSYSAILITCNLIIVYLVYRNWRDVKMRESKAIPNVPPAPTRSSR